jgi:hypothetical protein
VVLPSAVSLVPTHVILPVRGKNEVPSAHLYPLSVNSREAAMPFNDEPDGERGVPVSRSGFPWQDQLQARV